MQNVLAIQKALQLKYTEVAMPDFEGEPLSALFYGIISQRETDTRVNKSYTHFKEHFYPWDKLEHCPTLQLAEFLKTLKISHYNQKAEWITAIIRQVSNNYRTCSLKTAPNLPVILANFKGLGPKTLPMVMLFAKNQPFFPLNNDILRICRRIGWVKAGAPPREAVQGLQILQRWLSIPLLQNLHLTMSQHGKMTCKPNFPLCVQCVIEKFCTY